MATTLETLEKVVMSLPEDQRMTLAHRLMRSAEPPSDPSVDARWEAEIAHRIELLDAGATKRHRASDVFAELDQQLGP